MNYNLVNIDKINKYSKIMDMNLINIKYNMEEKKLIKKKINKKKIIKKKVRYYRDDELPFMSIPILNFEK